MFGRYGFSVCCACFEMQDVEEQQVNPMSSPEGFVKQLLVAARICDVPLEGENFSRNLDDESFQQVLRMSKLTPAFSFNFVRMDKSLFEPRNWASFSRFVRQISAVNTNLDISGGNASSPSAAAFAGGVLAY